MCDRIPHRTRGRARWHRDRHRRDPAPTGVHDRCRDRDHGPEFDRWASRGQPCCRGFGRWVWPNHVRVCNLSALVQARGSDRPRGRGVCPGCDPVLGRRIRGVRGMAIRRLLVSACALVSTWSGNRDGVLRSAANARSRVRQGRAPRRRAGRQEPCGVRCLDRVVAVVVSNRRGVSAASAMARLGWRRGGGAPGVRRESVGVWGHCRD